MIIIVIITYNNDHFLLSVLSQEKNLYSWTKEQEPPDLDRCADRIQLIDIEYYYRFMSDVKAEDIDNLVSQNLIIFLIDISLQLGKSELLIKLR